MGFKVRHCVWIKKKLSELRKGPTWAQTTTRSHLLCSWGGCSVVSSAAGKMRAYENLSMVVLHLHLLSSMSKYVPPCLLVKVSKPFERQHCSDAGKLSPYCCCIPFLFSEMHVLPGEGTYQFWSIQQDKVHGSSCEEKAWRCFFTDTSNKDLFLSTVNRVFGSLLLQNFITARASCRLYC